MANLQQTNPVYRQRFNFSHSKSLLESVTEVVRVRQTHKKAAADAAAACVGCVRPLGPSFPFSGLVRLLAFAIV